MKNGSFLYDLCTKNLQIYGQRDPQNVLAAGYFFAILPNCQHPKPNCALAGFAIGTIRLAAMATLQSRALQKSKCMFHYSHFDFKKLAK